MKTGLFIRSLFISIALLCSQHIYAEIVYEQQPMYGKHDKRNANVYTEGDQNLFYSAIRTFGTKEHASEGYTEKGFDLYSKGEFNKSMNRFNQAWLLNPENPYPYLGFGLLLNENKQPCKAYQMFKIANEKGLKESGFLADYAYTTSQCAVMKEQNEKESLFKLSNDLHKQATQTPNKRLLSYVYQSWAKSFFLQKNINKTHEMIDESTELGGKIDTSFLKEVNSFEHL